MPELKRTKTAVDPPKLSPNEVQSATALDSDLERFRVQHLAQTAQARLLAERTADALLTESWVRLIGPASKLVRSLLVEVLESNHVFGPGDHAFSSLADLARHARAGERTVQRWLSSSYRGKKWLDCWLSRRTLYMTREDGLPCRAGTVLRVHLEPKPTHDLTPAPKPRLEALKAPWRHASDLPGTKAQPDFAGENQLVTAPVANNRQFRDGTKTFPSEPECFLHRVQVEGRELLSGFPSSSTLISNSRHPDLEAVSGIAQPKMLTRAKALDASSWAKAEVVAHRLSDGHSTAFWYTQFRRALGEGRDDTFLFAAASQALEQRERGALRRKAAAYAVGILRRSGWLTA